MLCPVWDCVCGLLKLFFFFLKVYYRVEETDLVSVNETLAAFTGAKQEDFEVSGSVEDDNDLQTVEETKKIV